MLKEIRVPIIGYEGLYEISNYGNVYGLDRYVRNSETTYRLVKGKKLEPQKNTLRDNYLQIGLSKKQSYSYISTSCISGQTFYSKY